jgi:cell division protein FtsI/penicillin-binding protein 2
MVLGLALAFLVSTVALTATASRAAAAGWTSQVQPREAVERFLVLWRIGDYRRMHDVLAAPDRNHFTDAGFAAIHESLAQAVGLTGMDVAIGSPKLAARPAETRSPDDPAPPPPDLPTPEPSASPAPPIDPRGVVFGPVLAREVPVIVTLHTTLMGDVVLDRPVELTLGPTGWEVRWTPEFLFPEVGPTGGTFMLERGPLPIRGRILAADGTVLAETRSDGVRVYPQESLAGQTIGYATPLTDVEAAARPPVDGYQAGQLVGRRGVEAGAEALLRGKASVNLMAQPANGPAQAVAMNPEVPGADVLLTIQPDLQRTAEAALAPYAEAATAVVDPGSGDVWALASAPSFNPNAMTLGTTYAGAAIAAPSAAQMTNHATENGYPTGSSFKPFTLAAALQQGVASPATRMSCLSTWDLYGYTFHNYEDHQLGYSVDLAQAMAFSCNTTYMPLSMLVYNHNTKALTDLIATFGFGQPTGIGWIAETGGILPDALWFEGHRRGDGSFSPFGPFDQVQLAIGQGSFLGTPLQQTLAYAAFANRGTLWAPRLVQSATLPDGTVVLATEPEARRQIPVDRANLDYLVTTLQAVTTYSYGTATAAFYGFGIPVAGKSGTAESGGPDPHAWFPAFAPANDPTIVVSTVLARIHLGTGGSDAAPLVRRVMTTFFNR